MPNKIQISDVTARILKTSVEPLYYLTGRDPIDIKGLDHKMANYWIDKMTESHALALENISKSISENIPQIVSNFEVTI